MQKRGDYLKNNTLFKHLRKHIGGYCVALFALLVSVFLSMLSPQITMHIVDDVITAGNKELLPKLLLAILLVGGGRMLFQYIKEFTFDRMSVNVSSNLRRDLFTHIQSLDTSFFDKTNTGEIMARLKDDIDKIWNAVSFISMLLLEVFVHTVMIIYCMFRLNPIITIVPVLAMIFCAFLALYMEKKLDKVYEDISEENAVLNTTCEENIAGVRTVKAFAKEKYEIKKFLEHNEKYCELNITQSKIFVKYYPYFSFIGRIIPLIVVFLGGYFYIKGQMTLGEITAFISYASNIVWPMEMLGWLTNDFSSAVASVKKINKIFDEIPTITDKDDCHALDHVEGNIVFDNVSFHKEDMHNILSGISFTVPKGQTLGIMGATGAGKSSIISLLTRLYDATDGTITLDGVDIKDIPLKQLRGNISLVMQDVFLFSDTISENIKMGNRQNITAKHIRKASQRAGASEFIEKMENGYETVIGERGVGLSGGQKQRISIARALAKNLPILIMDDSTSALDMETEKEIQKELHNLKDMTKLIIAHRISSVKNADEIIVLDEGKVAERGTHDELLKKKGLYYETYVSQYGEPTLQEVI